MEIVAAISVAALIVAAIFALYIRYGEKKQAIEMGFCLSSSSDKQKNNSLRPLRLKNLNLR